MGVNGERLAVEKYVRRKNSIYANWRTRFDYSKLDNICTEAMTRFDKLPRWEEYVRCRRAGSSYWALQAEIEKEHRQWKNDVRKWCLESQITTFANQSAQFLKFYFAWYRYQYEQRHGKIERKYGRQMG